MTAIGATVAALAARYAVVKASQLAAAESREDRQQAREDRFADRVAKVAARLMNAGFDLAAAVQGHLADWRDGEPHLTEVPSMETIRRLVFELRMIVRTERTYQAVVAYSQMLYDVAEFDHDADAGPSLDKPRHDAVRLVRAVWELIRARNGFADQLKRKPYPADIDARWEMATDRLQEGPRRARGRRARRNQPVQAAARPGRLAENGPNGSTVRHCRHNSPYRK